MIKVKDAIAYPIICAMLLLLIITIFGWVNAAMDSQNSFFNERTAAWVQAIGTIIALFIAIYVPIRIHQNEQKAELAKRKRLGRLGGTIFAKNLDATKNWANIFLSGLSYKNKITAEFLKGIAFQDWGKLHSPDYDASVFDESVIDAHVTLLLSLGEFTRRRDTLIADIQNDEDPEVIDATINLLKESLREVGEACDQLASRIRLFLGQASHDHSSNS